MIHEQFRMIGGSRTPIEQWPTSKLAGVGLAVVMIAGPGLGLVMRVAWQARSRWRFFWCLVDRGIPVWQGVTEAPAVRTSSGKEAVMRAFAFTSLSVGAALNFWLGWGGQRLAENLRARLQTTERNCPRSWSWPWLCHLGFICCARSPF
jgi:hypothetical protein